MCETMSYINMKDDIPYKEYDKKGNVTVLKGNNRIIYYEYNDNNKEIYSKTLDVKNNNLLYENVKIYDKNSNKCIQEINLNIQDAVFTIEQHNYSKSINKYFNIKILMIKDIVSEYYEHFIGKPDFNNPFINKIFLLFKYKYKKDEITIDLSNNKFELDILHSDKIEKFKSYNYISEYDEHGNLIHFKNSDNFESFKKYDEHGNMLEYQSKNNEVITKHTSYRYDKNNNKLQYNNILNGDIKKYNDKGELIYNFDKSYHTEEFFVNKKRIKTVFNNDIFKIVLDGNHKLKQISNNIGFEKIDFLSENDEINKCKIERHNNIVIKLKREKDDK